MRKNHIGRMSRDFGMIDIRLHLEGKAKKHGPLKALS